MNRAVNSVTLYVAKIRKKRGSGAMGNFISRQFHQNEVIFKEGSRGNVAYILKDGRVEISMNSGDDKIVLAVLEPVSVFGEMALLMDDNRRVATATALQYSEAVEIDKETFDTYIDKSPKVIGTILKVLVERLKKVNQMVTKGPDLFLGACEILNILAQHASRGIPYDAAVKAIAAAFLSQPDVVEEKIRILENMNLVEVKEDNGVTVIVLTQKEQFLARTRKIHEALSLKR